MIYGSNGRETVRIIVNLYSAKHFWAKSVLLKEDCVPFRPSVLDPFHSRGAVCVVKPCPPFRNEAVGPISELVTISRGSGLFTEITDNAGCLGIVANR